MRYVIWIADIRESSNLWTHIAPFGIPKGMPVWASFLPQTPGFGVEQYARFVWKNLTWKLILSDLGLSKNAYFASGHHNLFHNFDLKSGRTTRWT